MRFAKHKLFNDAVEAPWLFKGETRKVRIVFKEKGEKGRKVHVKRASFAMEVPIDLSLEEFVKMVKQKLKS